MRILSSLVIAVVAIVLFAACNSTDRSSSSTPPASPPAAKNGKLPETIHADGARRITVPEAQELLAKGQAIMVDVRNQASYDLGHIRGARLIPTAEVGLRAEDLPRDKTIITYCS